MHLKTFAFLLAATLLNLPVKAQQVYTTYEGDEYKPAEVKITTINKEDYVKEKYPCVIAQNLLLYCGLPYYPDYYPHYNYVTDIQYERNTQYDSRPHLPEDVAYTLYSAPYLHRPPKDGFEKNVIRLHYYQKKAIIRINTDVMADLDIPEGQIALITQTPSTFNLVNFRYLKNIPEIYKNDTVEIGPVITDGSFKGQVTLSADETGDIKLSMNVYNYTLNNHTKKFELKSREYLNDFIVKNLYPVKEWLYDVVVKEHPGEKEKLLVTLEHIARNLGSAVRASGYMENTMKVTVLKRSENGQPIKVRGDYSFSQSDEWKGYIELSYQDGLPWGITSTHYPVNYTEGWKYFFFNTENVAKINGLIKVGNNILANEMETKRKASLNALIKYQAATYPRGDCSSCLVRRTGSQEERGDKQESVQTGANNQEVVTAHDQVTGNATMITIENTCNKKIYVIGIKKSYTAEKGIFYEDFTQEFEPKQGYSFKFMGLTQILGIDKDIDLSRINMPYNDDIPAGYVQYINIKGAAGK